MKRTIAQELAVRVVSRANCIETDNLNWASMYEDQADDLIKRALPSGSGINYGTYLDYAKSNQDKIVLTSAYRVINDNGYDTGIIDYRVIITASLLSGIDVNIVGNFNANRDAYGVKEYLLDIYTDALMEGA